MLNITDVRITKVEGDEKLRGFAAIVIDDSFIVGDLRVLDYNGNRVFERLSFEEIGHPHVYDKNTSRAGAHGREEIHP